MTQKHLFFVNYALRLGEQGRWTAPPNPWVGCVIVKDETIVGKGFHATRGAPHAEVLALKEAGDYARGATVYTTLEPCAHHGRTPPCTEALIRAGVSRVVFPLIDPDPKVAGKGKEALEVAGIDVITGIGVQEATASLRPYLHHRKTGRPYVVAKIASSLDGRAAASDGSSQWITSEEARLDGHRLRAASSAILVGAGTVLADDPKLTVRGLDQPHATPLRIVLDRSGRISSEAAVFDLALGPSLAVGAPKQGVETLPFTTLEALLATLGQRGIIQLLIEGGPTLQAAFFAEGLVNRCSLYLGNCLLGEKGLPAFPPVQVTQISKAPRLELAHVYRFGQTVRLDYEAG